MGSVPDLARADIFCKPLGTQSLLDILFFIHSRYEYGLLDTGGGGKGTVSGNMAPSSCFRLLTVSTMHHSDTALQGIHWTRTIPGPRAGSQAGQGLGGERDVATPQPPHQPHC